MYRIAQKRRAVAPLCAVAVCALTSTLAHAVVVRGVVRDPLGRPISVAHVRLVKGQQVVASTVTLPDGSFEIRSSEDGRFVLLADAPTFSAALSDSFYGGQLDVVRKNLQLAVGSIKQDITVTATGEPTPVQQTSASVSLIDPQALRTRVDVVSELRLQPGVAVVQTGQYGGLTSLFVRGADSSANKVLFDDVPANDVGGAFDFGTVSSTALATVETHRGPDSILYGTDARAGVVRFETPHGTTLKPVLTYSGDAGNLHTWRNEGTLSGTYGKADYFAGFSRFDSSNALANDRYHAATSAANLGYNLSANTSIRGTVRNSVSATGLPGQYDFYGLTQIGKQADQDTYMSGAIDDTRSNGWHNTFRYIGGRKREQAYGYQAVGTPDGFGDYYGNVVTIRGANGTVATGASIIGYDPFPTYYEFVNNRDGLDYRTTYSVTRHLTALGGFRFQDERGVYRYPLFGSNSVVGRSNYDYTLEFHGDAWHRLFYTFGGAIQRNSLYGTEGEPQIGLTYYVVQPGHSWMHGTRLHGNFAKGVQEPNLDAQLSSLYTKLLAIGDTTDIAKFKVSPIGAQRSRVYEAGVDQNIYSDRAVLHVTYFHSTYGRGTEGVPVTEYNAFFNQTLPNVLGSFYLNSLDTTGSGVEAALEYQVLPRLFVRGGYTYTDALVKRSFATDAIDALGGVTTVNPNYPNIPIGMYSPLVGQRPFRRPPQTGFFTVQYNGTKWTAALKGAVASKSDDSTFIASYSAASFDNTMLLPNRNLDPGFTKLDGNITYQARPSLQVFTQLDNLTNNQHMGPIGYPSLPFTFRVGLKVRIPHE